MSEVVEIVRLGHGGHGATSDGLFVPFALPGDVVRVARVGARAQILTIEKSSPSRVDATCRHFGRCGGCAVQHYALDDYHAWKRGLVSEAMAQRGFSEIPLAPILGVRPGTRRRAMMKAKKSSTFSVGFFEPESHTLVDVTECPVLLPELVRLIAPLRAGLDTLMRAGDTAELHMTATDSGVDLSLRWKHPRDPMLLMDMAALARGLDLARLSWNGEPISIQRSPSLQVGRYTVNLPLEPFLQPTREGERMLQALVLEAIGSAEKIADLYCGCGTFALAMADGRKIHAVDDGLPMIEALESAGRAGGARVKIERRDLHRRPLSVFELARFDAVVVDPPRPGAAAQARELANSLVPRIVYVSCNAATFARDARILVDGGYRLEKVTPVDQFLWSPHVELVAVFGR